MRFLVTEVHNFGGFFGGDTVTLSGHPWRAEEAAEQTLTIDEAALANVTARHTIAAGMLLELTMAGERVERAVLIGAADQASLRQALGPPELPTTLESPIILSYRCPSCGLWVPASDVSGQCPACGSPKDS